MRILVAEDEADLARTLRKALAEDGYAVDWAPDGNVALDKASVIPYDTILLDVMLPGRSGLAVLAALRERAIRTPVLILTARDALDDKVRGLDVGADDYMTKPFALTELLARVRALIRRASPEPVNDLVVGPFVVDTCARVVRQGGTVVDLTARSTPSSSCWRGARARSSPDRPSTITSTTIGRTRSRMSSTSSSPRSAASWAPR